MPKVERVGDAPARGRGGEPQEWPELARQELADQRRAVGPAALEPVGPRAHRTFVDAVGVGGLGERDGQRDLGCAGHLSGTLDGSERPSSSGEEVRPIHVLILIEHTLRSTPPGENIHANW